MTDFTPPTRDPLDPEVLEAHLQALLYKQGNWVDWGNHCQILQHHGYGAAQIFEATGFQASQQNLVIVASQVFASVEQGDSSPEMLTYFRGPRSDVLHEFRILNQEQRVQAARLAYEKKVDVDGAKLIARAIKDLNSLSQPPSGFTADPGDAVAYQAWRHARQKKDLMERSRLIAQGLKFAHSPSAREKLEQLLSDFSVVTTKSEPLLPLYRLEEEEELSRIIPFLGAYPISPDQVNQAPILQSQDPFGLVQIPTAGAYVTLPGWHMVLKTQQPVAFLIQSEQLPKAISQTQERLLMLVDRAEKIWDENSYFLMETPEGVRLAWTPEPPNDTILGKVIVVLRPKKILDEGNLTQPWQMDD